MIPAARKDGLLVSEVDDEIIVYDLERDRAHRLNGVTALVWRHCDGRTSVAELASVLPPQAGTPPREHIVRLALQQLDRACLLAERLDPAIVQPAMSRRQLLAMTVLGAGSLMLPACDSITAPEPGAAFAGVQQQGLCGIELLADRTSAVCQQLTCDSICNPTTTTDPATGRITTGTCACVTGRRGGHCGRAEILDGGATVTCAQVTCTGRCNPKPTTHPRTGLIASAICECLPPGEAGLRGVCAKAEISRDRTTAHCVQGTCTGTCAPMTRVVEGRIIAAWCECR